METLIRYTNYGKVPSRPIVGRDYFLSNFHEDGEWVRFNGYEEGTFKYGTVTVRSRYVGDRFNRGHRIGELRHVHVSNLYVNRHDCTHAHKMRYVRAVEIRCKCS